MAELNGCIVQLVSYVIDDAIVVILLVACVYTSHSTETNCIDVCPPSRRHCIESRKGLGGSHVCHAASISSATLLRMLLQ